MGVEPTVESIRELVRRAVAEEREACARAAEEAGSVGPNRGPYDVEPFGYFKAVEIAAAIRARGQSPAS